MHCRTGSKKSVLGNTHHHIINAVFSVALPATVVGCWPTSGEGSYQALPKKTV